MLDRHAVQELLLAGVGVRAVTRQFHVSRRTIERIAREGAITSGEDGVIRAGSEVTRGAGRPRVTEAMRARIEALLIRGLRASAGGDIQASAR